MEASGRCLRQRAHARQTEGSVGQQESNQEEYKSRLREQVLARDALYVHGALRWQNVPELAQLWLRELKDKGLNKLDQASKPLEEKVSGVSGFLSQYPRDVLYPVRFGKDSEQVLWLRPYDLMIKENGYMNTEVLLEPEAADVAIFTATTVMEISGQELDVTKLRKAFSLVEWPLKQNVYDYMITYQWLKHSFLEPDEVFEEFKRDIKEYPEGQIDDYLAGQVRAVGWVVSLLRQEQVALIERNISAAKKLVEAAKGFVASVQEGKPWSGRPKKSVKLASRYIKAALLADVEDLSATEIGRRLGLERSKTDEVKGQNRKAREAVSSGRDLFEGALGEDGYRKLINDYKSQREWFRSLSNEEQELEWRSDALRRLVQSGGYSVEHVRSMFRKKD